MQQMKLPQPKITFIGVGHMATAMIKGLMNHESNVTITATNKSLEKLQHLPDSVIKTTDNNTAIANADIVILAVKPQVLQPVIASLHIEHQPLFISVAASTSIAKLEQWLGKQHAIVRCMPNMPATVGQAATGAIGNGHVHAEQQQLTELVLNAIGITVWLDDEKHIDTVTAIAGSAPAYYFYLLEILQDFAIKQGLTAEQARLLAAQTCMGSGTLAMQSQQSFIELKQSIMSPGGLTEAAINNLAQQNLPDIMQNAIDALLQRSKALAD